MAEVRASEAFDALRRRWLAYLGLSGLGLACLAGLLAQAETPTYAGRWAAQAGLVLALEAWAVWRVLPDNVRAGEEELLPTLGWGNILTLARGTLIALLAGFLWLERPTGGWAWLPAGIYLLADFTDFYDGYLARRSNQATRLGERLDMNHDSLGVAVAAFLAFQHGAAPWWYALFGFARYIFLLGLWNRRRLGLAVHDLPPNPARRVFAALQMGLVTALLFPIFEPPGTSVAATLFMIPFLAGFLYDWMHVSGRWMPRPAANGARRRAAWDFISEVLPLALRAVAVAVALPWLAQEESRLGQPWGTLEAVAVLGLGLGAAARICSTALLLFLGLRLAESGANPAAWGLMAACIGVVFLGPGRWHLWGPEEWFVRHRAGEREDA
jgi:CDP-diacylglycerol--glycerol-3-phosphate 3-phosphatidyltransferase